MRNAFDRLDGLTPLEALGSLHVAYQATDDVDLAEVMHHLERLFQEV